MLVVIHCDDGNDYSVLTMQPRLAIGKFEMLEIPAGMIDNDENFAGVAAKELKEEAGIIVKSNELKDLSEYAVDYDRAYPSCGACDEFMKFYLYETRMTKEALNELEAKVGGAYEEGETIKLKVVKLCDLARNSPDMKTLSALYLYEKYLKRCSSL